MASIQELEERLKGKWEVCYDFSLGNGRSEVRRIKCDESEIKEIANSLGSYKFKNGDSGKVLMLERLGMW